MTVCRSVGTILNEGGMYEVGIYSEVAEQVGAPVCPINRTIYRANLNFNLVNCLP